MESKYIKISLLLFSSIVAVSSALFAVADDKPNVFLDSDQDRLTDEEEKNSCTDPNNPDTDGDGYTDGIEVEGGYDPCKPADLGDKIGTVANGSVKTKTSPLTSKAASANKTATAAPADNTPSDNTAISTETAGKIADSANVNQTEELSSKLAAAVSTADGSTGIDMSTINEIVSSSMDTEIDFDQLPEIDPANIKIKKQDYEKLSDEERTEKEKQDSIEYLVSVAYLAAANAPAEISDPSDLTKLSQEIITQANISAATMSDFSYFDGIAEKGESFMKQIKDVEVPENLLDKHIKGLQLGNYAISMKDKFKPDMTDPIASIKSLSKVQGAIGLAMDYSMEISSELTKLGIAEIPLDF